MQVVPVSESLVSAWGPSVCSQEIHGKTIPLVKLFLQVNAIR